jgi:hypothetical protein
MIARVSNLHKTEAEWRTYLDLIPNAGELIIYDPDETFSYARFKVGDGKTPLKDLDFFIDLAVEDILKKYSFSGNIDAGRIN